jgi:tetratricopeptide (TPR) repeat protein
MRIRSGVIVLVLSAAVVAPCLASISGAPKPDPPTSTSPGVPPAGSTQASGPRQEAELAYALAYEEVGKAKKDLADGKAKNAEKKFKRALERGERAVALDAKYHEAWNLIGYTSRRLGQLDKAFAAYEKCLALKPDYAPAREYLGEAWLDCGDLKKAREQLVMLEHLEAEQEALSLGAAILKWETTHPAAAVVDSTAAPDSSAAAGGGSQ